MSPQPAALGLAQSVSIKNRQSLNEGWHFQSLSAGSHDSPESLPPDGTDWQTASVPGTVASALRDAGSLDVYDEAFVDALSDLDHLDHWFRLVFETGGPTGESTQLVFHGLATFSEIWLNDAPLGTCDNMFVRSDFDVTGRLQARNTLWICFRALTPALTEKRARARWRTRLVSDRNLRFIRTTLLGRMPSWCPSIAPVGPWRGIELISKGGSTHTLERVALHTTLDLAQNSKATSAGPTGRVDVEIDLVTEGFDPRETKAWLEIGQTKYSLEIDSVHAGSLHLEGRIENIDVEPWWPHTHGRPQLYAVRLGLKTSELTRHWDLDPIGFRHVERHGPPGPCFSLEINGEPIFFRGTNWTPVDSLALGCSLEAMREALVQARDGGMNLLRLPGTGVYESDEFYSLCDELGIMVWQDFMFATLDYPSDDECFVRSVQKEAGQFLDRVSARVCLGVLCGNSEGQQQPAMLGLGPETWKNPIFDELLPELCQAKRPDVPYWPSTPSGGALPFHPDHGTSHYFGVGAYRRPLTDARLAKPRFMTECLALANVPGAAGADTTKVARIPRDTGTDWDFKDVTKHYLIDYFGEEAADNASRNPRLEAALLRATSARLMQDAATLWRDPESDCRGSLVWLHRDPWTCAGWGVIGADGQPKSAYFGLKRAWAPRALAILDEGLNGLRILAFNDRDTEFEASLLVRLMRFDGTQIDEARETLRIEARGAYSASVDSLIGEFVDSSYGYRFGPRAFDLCVAELEFDSTRAIDGNDSFQVVHVPADVGLLPAERLGLQVDWVESCATGEVVSISTARFAQSVVLDLESGLASDNFFDLAPNAERKVIIQRSGEGTSDPLIGTLSALNATDDVRFSLDLKAMR